MNDILSCGKQFIKQRTKCDETEKRNELKQEISSAQLTYKIFGEKKHEVKIKTDQGMYSIIK